MVDSTSGAVNRSGALLATYAPSGPAVSIENASNFSVLHSFNTLDSNGVAFDALHDTLYGINSSSDQIIAYDTTTFSEKFRFNIGENVQQFGMDLNRLVASQDSHYVALMRPTRVLVFAVPPVPLVSVTSKMTQGSSNFSISLPLEGTPGIECRSGGANGNYTIEVTFSRNVTFANASLTSGSGMVTNTSGSGTTVASVSLTSISNAQTVNVTLPNVNDGMSITNLVIPMSILIGDTNGNGSVNASDIGQTKLQSGQPITASNFREDVSGNGTINASDVSLVKSKSGTALP